jgi:hypothetical protein
MVISSKSNRRECAVDPFRSTHRHQKKACSIEQKKYDVDSNDRDLAGLEEPLPLPGDRNKLN